MAYRIKNHQSQLSVLNSPGWQRRTLPPELGRCFIDQCVLEPGLTIAYSHYHPNQDLIEESTIEQEGISFSLTYGLTGTSQYRPKQLHQDDFVFQPNFSTASTFANTVGERVFKADEIVSQLRIIVNSRLFERYQIPFDANPKATPMPRKHLHGSITSNTAHFVRRLAQISQIHCGERPLEKHILTLNLLSEQLSLLSPEDRADKSSHRVSDLKILQARDLMLDNLASPLSLTYVAQQVGISESKLQKGFKHYFGVSPYQLLLEARMQKAHDLLHAGYQVAQVAYAVGYEHPSNFSAAFRQFFGMTPKSISRS